jgi:MATE family multidrug resistance protein
VRSDAHSVSEVVALVASILPLVATYQVFDGIAAVTGGVLRAQGKQVSARSFRCTL